MVYSDKYHLTLQQNLFLAKRNLIDSIWKSAQIEGINVTFPQTYAIVEKATVQNVSVEDILKITNLKHAWQILINEPEAPLTLEWLCKIHAEVAKDEALQWGVLRTGEIGVGGTAYIPPIPNAEDVCCFLKKMEQITSPTERAIELMFRLIKQQLFWDGNKRTAMLAANHVMIANGCGLILIPENQIETFQNVLLDYYNRDTLEDAKRFIYDNCIQGIDFPEQEQNIAKRRKSHDLSIE